MPKHSHSYKPLLDTQPAKVRAAIDAKTEPYYSAWTSFRDGRLKSALKATPSVYAGGNVVAYNGFLRVKKS